MPAINNQHIINESTHRLHPSLFPPPRRAGSVSVEVAMQLPPDEVELKMSEVARGSEATTSREALFCRGTCRAKFHSSKLCENRKPKRHCPQNGSTQRGVYIEIG